MSFRALFTALSACVATLTPSPASANATEGEDAAAKVFDRVVQNPARLRVFLQAMPKGADLHNHVSGTAYAEDYLGWAAAAGYCFDPTMSAIAPPPCAVGQALDGIAKNDPNRYAGMIDALSTRAYLRGVGRNEASGHTQFFGSFGRFGAIASVRSGESIAAAQRLAAGDNVLYLELIHNPESFGPTAFAGAEEALDEAGFDAALTDAQSILPGFLAKARADMDTAEAKARKVLDCDGARPDPGCAVTVRYLAYTGRSLPPAKVFRGLVLAFALVAADPRFVGVNIVAPEDWPVSIDDYGLHMAMFRFLAERYPDVPTSLHAGELTLGIVPPAALRDHIGKAVTIAGAQRIGHGTDIAFESGAPAIMAEMARRRIAVEINLSSNAVILGVEGASHPLNLYRAAGVPVVLSSDDMGILRSDLTNDYVRAASDHGLRYPDLKAVSRAGLEYAFVPGESLWQAGVIGTRTSRCATSSAAACKALLLHSPKAALQAKLEAELEKFERDVISWRF